MRSGRMLLASANLYAYKVDEHMFDKVSLAWYMASGKFDKNSMSRWTRTMTKLKAQILRSSIDNSIVFIPVGNTLSLQFSRSQCKEDLRGHLILLCCNTRVYGIGVVVQGPCACPKEYEITDMKRLLAVHVLATSFTETISLQELNLVERCDSLPEHVYKLVDVISDSIEIDMPSSWMYTYEQHVMFAHWFVSFINTLKNLETPVKILEDARKKRLCSIMDCVSQHKDIIFPPPRPFVFSKMMKTHAKYARLFGHLE
jgi:hypothetical protein